MSEHRGERRKVTKAVSWKKLLNFLERCSEIPIVRPVENRLRVGK